MIVTMIDTTAISEDTLTDIWGVVDNNTDSLLCLFRDPEGQLDCLPYSIDINILRLKNIDEEYDECYILTFHRESSLSIFFHEMPNEYALLSNYPNPFNPTTSIRYKVPYYENVTMEIINIRGQIIKTLVQQLHQPGNYEIIWDGTDHKSQLVSSGIYFYRMSSPQYASTKKLIMLK